MCAETPPCEVTIPMDMHAAGRARALLRDELCTAHLGLVMEDAQLLVSELVGNAVRHASPPLAVSLECEDGCALLVRVRDGETRPRVAREAAEEDEGGRGMTLVDFISSAWGVESEATGKAVWFRLTPPAVSPACA